MTEILTNYWEKPSEKIDPVMKNMDALEQKSTDIQEYYENVVTHTHYIKESFQSETFQTKEALAIFDKYLLKKNKNKQLA